MSYQELKKKVVKVRKIHECVWCGENIWREQLAVYRVYLLDDDFNTDYMHLECSDAMEKSEYDLSDGFSPGEFLRGLTVEETDELQYKSGVYPISPEPAKESIVKNKSWIGSILSRIVNYLWSK